MDQQHILYSLSSAIYCPDRKKKRGDYYSISKQEKTSLAGTLFNEVWMQANPSGTAQSFHRDTFLSKCEGPDQPRNLEIQREIANVSCRMLLFGECLKMFNFFMLNFKIKCKQKYELVFPLFLNIKSCIKFKEKLIFGPLKTKSFSGKKIEKN